MEPSTSTGETGRGDPRSLSVRKRRGADTFCWICHDSTNVKLDFECKRCGRAFHYGCDANKTKDGRAPRDALPAGLTLYGISSFQPSCPVCYHVKDGIAQLAPSELSELNRALSFVCDKLIEYENSHYFLNLGVESKKYQQLIASPMTLRFLERKAKNGGFTSAEEFLYDFKLIQHNAVLYYKKDKVASYANELYEIGFFEYCKVSYCYQCYLRSVVDKMEIYQGDQFLVACNRPHGLVWAQVPGHGYEPAKIINISAFKDGKKNSKFVPAVDVCVFGSREKVTDLKMDQCFVYSQNDPTGLQVSLKETVKLELDKYMESVMDAIAKPRCAIKLESVVPMIPEYASKLTLESLYLVKKVKSNGFSNDPIVDVTFIPLQTAVAPAPQHVQVVASNQSRVSSAVKRASSSKKKDSNAKVSKTLEQDSLQIKITIDSSHYDQFQPRASTSKSSTAASTNLSPSSAVSDAPSQAQPKSNAKGSSTVVANSLATKSLLPGAQIKQEPVDSIVPIPSTSKVLTSSATTAEGNSASSATGVNSNSTLAPIACTSECSNKVRLLEAMSRRKAAIIDELKKTLIKVHPSSKSSLLGKWCKCCYQTRITNHMCCNDEYYCSLECQHDDWIHHEKICTRVKRSN